MLEKMIKSVVGNMINDNLSHLKYPSVLHAKITKSTNAGKHYIYSIKILDTEGLVDESFPEIPNVKSNLSFEYGKIVCILLTYGEINPYIVGEVIQ